MQISQTIRRLTYLELCVVPAFIQPFLSRLSPSEIKATNFLYMQTFFQLNPDTSKINPLGQPTSVLIEYRKRPIGQQMINLLKKTLQFYIRKDYPLHTFFLQFDPNTQPLMISLQKIILHEMFFDGQNDQTILRPIMLALDICLQLFQIKRGNAKFILNVTGKNQSQMEIQVQYVRRQKYLRMISEAEIIRNSETSSQNLKQFCDYILNLGSKYEFVVLSKLQKQNKKQHQKPQQLLIEQQIQQAIQNTNLSINSSQYWLLPSHSDSCEMIIRNYLNLIKNFSQQTTNNIQKLNNCALMLINQLTESRSQSQLQTRISLYSIVVGLKVLSGLKQKYINLDELAQTSQSNFKQIMQLQTCPIDSTFYFLLAFLKLDIQQEAFYNRMVNIIGWVMSQYRKYIFKNEELIYADFIASTLDLLVSWKSSLKPDEEQKQIENVLQRLSSKSKTHGENHFGIFFQTLNPKLLNYVSVCLIKAQTVQIPKIIQNSQLLNLVLSNFQQNISNYLSEFSFSKMIERPKGLQAAQTILLYVYFIIYQKKESYTPQQIISMKLYHLTKIILDKNKKNHQYSTLMLAKECLSQCLSHFLHSVNTVLLQYNVSSAKKNQINVVVPNQINKEVKIANKFLQESIKMLVFLSLEIFVINPTENKSFLLFALVFNSFEQTTLQLIPYLYENINSTHKINWSQGDIQLLKCSRRYDTLQIFYEQVLQRIDKSQSQRESKLLAFQNLCRKWCLQQNNYQWLSDQKASRIRLVQLKKFCLKIKEQYKL